ncbi:MAG TPA: PilZ domain-containing protein [Nitrospiria bacterium]
MDQKDRRNSPRVPIIIEIQFSSNSPPITARITDVSERGVFIDTVNPLQSGDQVKFNFRLSNSPSEKPIDGEGTVVWNQQTVGMGIEFSQLSEENKKRLNDFIKNQG